jgi:hypothetical protein
MMRPRSGIRTLVVDVGVPPTLYYVLRAAGASVVLALSLGAIVPAASTLAGLIRSRALDRLGTFVLSTMLLGVGVSLISGSPRLLLAKEAWLTTVIGVWLLLSSRRERPLSFVFARAALGGQKRFTTESRDRLSERSPNFRRGWRISSVTSGVGLVVDAAPRVAFAHSPTVDAVPALSAALFPVTVTILALIDQINYRANRLRQLILARPHEAAA